MSSTAVTDNLTAGTPPAATTPNQLLSQGRQNVLGYVGVVVLTCLIVVYTLRLWHADLRVPFIYAGDNLLNQTLIQSMMENGWYLDNPRLGLPLSQNMRDFPLADTLHLALLKLLAWIFADSAVALNLYGLLTFPLVALSSYFVFRRFKFDRLLAIVAAVLYACAPFHFARFVGHLFLAAYYMLPLMTLVMVRIYLGRSPFVDTDPHTGTARWRLLSGSSVGAVLIAALTGIAGVYYAFFSCFLLLVVGIKASFRARRWAPVVSALVLIVVISLCVGAAVLPTLLYNAEQGANPAVAGRLPVEADIYGLNVLEMLLPPAWHRLACCRELHDGYMLAPRQPTGESYFAAIGTLAALGFLWLIGRFLWRRRARVERIDDALAYLTVLAVMLATLGGIGAFFNFSITPMIRCYGRINIFIAFFALGGLFFLLQRLVNRHGTSRRALVGYALASGVLLLVGISDQTSRGMIPSYSAMARVYAADVEFGQRMEAIMPRGAMIYQFPFVPFPEEPPVYAMGDYELFRPYLHTRSLRWTYGGMKGRDAHHWHKALAQRPFPEVIEQLAFAGFSGIYIDRAGFADKACFLERKLSKLLRVEPLVSQTDRQSFFDLRPYAATLRSRYSREDWQALHGDALHPVELRWDGFSKEEADSKQGRFRWCGKTGAVRIINPQTTPRRAVLRLACSGWQQQPVSLVIDGLIHRELSLTSTPQTVTLPLLVPPGEHTLQFICAGPRLAAPGDPRVLVFRVWNVKWTVEPLPASRAAPRQGD